MPEIESFIKNSLILRFPIMFIAIDSIVALFRSDFENTMDDLKKRSSWFFKIPGKLKAMAVGFDLAVVVINQVVDLVEPNEGINGLRVGNLGCFFSSGRPTSPAMAIAWANCVNSRLFLSRNEDIVGHEIQMVNIGSGGSEDFVCTWTRRWLHVVFLPHIAL